MTSTSILLSRIDYEVAREILLDYIAMLTEKNMSDNVIDVATQAKLSDARYLLERIQHNHDFF
jgi:hypothetical protein